MAGLTDSLANDNFCIRSNITKLEGMEDLHGRVVERLIKAVYELRGARAAHCIESRGIERLHEVIATSDFGGLRERVLEEMREPLLAMGVAVGRKLLHWGHDFYVDDYLILRINIPYSVAVQSDCSGENPGVGRLSPTVRDIFNSRKLIDPVFNPKAYHRGLPPAAWAHGPHLDSWSGHSKNGRNIWWAIGEVPAEAGMVFYPELAGQPLPLEPKTLYIRAGYPLPKPTYVPLSAGEMLLFDPEILHGTHLNITDETRVAISLRLNASKPRFDPRCFYAREFWHLAGAIESGSYEVLHLKREDNLDNESVDDPIQTPRRPTRIQGAYDENFNTVRCLLNATQNVDRRIFVDCADDSIMLVKVKNAWKAYDAQCPVNGVDLADGGCDEEKTYCPGCAVGFDLNTGESCLSSLSLPSHDVQQQGETLVVHLDSRPPKHVIGGCQSGGPSVSG